MRYCTGCGRRSKIVKECDRCKRLGIPKHSSNTKEWMIDAYTNSNLKFSLRFAKENCSDKRVLKYRVRFLTKMIEETEGISE